MPARRPAALATFARRPFTRRLLGGALGLALASPTLAGAAPVPPGGVTTRDFRIETDQTNSNLNDGNFSMPHRVKFFRPGTDVVGDSAKGNYKNGTVTIVGHVVLHDNGQAAEAQAAGAAAGGGPSTLECDRLDVDSRRKVYAATGSVRYVQGTRRATADSGRLDQGAHVLELSGNVRLADGEQTLTAQTVRYDTLSKDVSTSGNPVTLHGPVAPALSGTTSTLPSPASSKSPLGAHGHTAPAAAKASPKPG